MVASVLQEVLPPVIIYLFICFFFDETWVQKHVFFSFFPLLKHEKSSGLQDEDNL